MNLSTLSRFGLLAVLVIGCACSCSRSLESRLGPAYYEVYYLQGTEEYRSTAGAALDTGQLELISPVMEGLVLDADLFYNVVDKHNGTRLGPSYITVRGIDRTAVGAPAVDGTMAIDENQCLLDITLPATPAEYTEVKLDGTFSKDDAQFAIDKLRKSSDEPGWLYSTEQWEIHWTLNGIHNSSPFEVEFTQVFKAKRNRFDASPVPGIS